MKLVITLLIISLGIFTGCASQETVVVKETHTYSEGFTLSYFMNSQYIGDGEAAVQSLKHVTARKIRFVLPEDDKGHFLGASSRLFAHWLTSGTEIELYVGDRKIEIDHTIVLSGVVTGKMEAIRWFFDGKYIGSGKDGLDNLAKMEVKEKAGILEVYDHMLMPCGPGVLPPMEYAYLMHNWRRVRGTKIISLMDDYTFYLPREDRVYRKHENEEQDN